MLFKFKINKCDILKNESILVELGQSYETNNYSIYGGRSAEREVSVLSAESVMRAVNYDRFAVKTFFISQSGDFIKTQEFTQTPGQDERLMTNETIDWDKKIAPSAIYEEGAVVFPVLRGPMGEDGSVQRFLRSLENALCGL